MRAVVSILLLAAVAAIAGAAPPPPKGWTGQPLPILPEDTQPLREGYVWLRKGLTGRTEYKFANKGVAMAGWTWACEVSYGLSKMGGWHVEQYHANPALIHGTQQEGEEAYYSVGFADGYTTAQRLWNSMIVTFFDDYATTVVNATTKNAKWTQSMLKRGYNFTLQLAEEGKSHFALNLRKQLAMYRGRADGYNARLRAAKAGFEPALLNDAHPITFDMMYYMGMAVDRFGLGGVATYGVSGKPWTEYEPWAPDKMPWAAPDDNGGESHSGNPQVSSGIAHANGNTRQPYHHHHCMCGTKLTDDDLWYTRTTLYQYMNMNSSITVYTLESQVALVRQQDSMGSLEDFYMTSNKLILCSVQDVTYDPRWLSQVTADAVGVNFLGLYAAVFATGAPDLMQLMPKYHGIVPTTWMVLDFKKFVPAANGKKASLQPNAVWGYDVFPGDIILGEDLTKNYTDGAVVVAGTSPVTRAAYTTFHPPCQWCWLRVMAQDPSDREFPGLAKDSKSLESFFRWTRYNRWKTDSFSMMKPPMLNGTRCGALAIAARYDLGAITGYFENMSWAMAICQSGVWGVIDSTATSWKTWIGDTNTVNTPVKSFPFIAILGPTYENPDTPPFQPEEAGPTQAPLYWFNPIMFKLEQPPERQVAPHDSIVGGGGDGSGSTAGKWAVAGAVIVGFAVASVFVVGSLVRRRREVGALAEDTPLVRM